MRAFGYFTNRAMGQRPTRPNIFRDTQPKGFYNVKDRLAWHITMLFEKTAILLISCVLLGSCNSSDTAPEPEEQALSELTVFPEKMVVIAGDGLYLETTAKDLMGDVLPDIIPNFTSSDPEIIRIEPDGRIQALKIGTVTVTASYGGQSAQIIFYVGSPTYDLATLGPPKILSANYIDLSKIDRISRFRSTAGHSYVDGSGETCRSMKHYFVPPFEGVDWTDIDIYAPVSGTFGGAGLLPKDVPSMAIQIFHWIPDPGLRGRSWVNAGDHIGKHATFDTSSDIAISFGGKEDGILISYFDVITDDVFAQFQERGLMNREDAIITAAERDADPVPCEGELQFDVHGTIEDWIYLN